MHRTDRVSGASASRRSTGSLPLPQARPLTSPAAQNASANADLTLGEGCICPWWRHIWPPSQCQYAMTGCKAPSPYLQRLNIPALHDQRFIADLSPQDLEASWLHPIVLKCGSAPLLWSPAEWPHLRVSHVASRLLVAMLKLTRSSVQTVSKELVIQLKMWEYQPTTCSMTAAEVQDCQAAETLVGAANTNQPNAASSSRATEAVEALEKAQQWYEALSSAEQYTAKAEALFQCPPVVDRGEGRCIRFFSSCWPIRQKTAGSLRTLEWSGGYPVLVLQEQGPQGSKVHKVSILMKDLVIYMTQGPKPAGRPCVLHCHDVVRFQGRSRLQWQQLQEPWELMVQQQQGQLNRKPHPAGCNCKTCINPMCLLYGTQSDIAEVCSTLLYRKRMKKRGWHYICPPGCLNCVRLLVNQAGREASEAAKAAAGVAVAAAAAAAAVAAGASAVETRRSSRLKRKQEQS